jgi:hypothetical protein
MDAKSNEYGYPVNLKGHDYYHFVDMETGESTLNSEWTIYSDAHMWKTVLFMFME